MPDECGYCSIKSCQYFHRNKIRTPDPNSNYLNHSTRNIRITERNNCIRNKVIHTPDRSYYINKKRIILTTEGGDGCRHRNVACTPDKSYYFNKKIIRTSEDINDYMKKNIPCNQERCYINKNIVRKEENYYQNRHLVLTPDRQNCDNLYEMYARTPNRMRSNYKYFWRIKKNRTPDRTHRVTSNYYKFENTPDSRVLKLQFIVIIII
jgi:hypothetical protein